MEWLRSREKACFLGGLAWGEKVQFFGSGYGIPAPVYTQFAVQVDGVTLGSAIGNIQYLGDFFDAGRSAQ